MKGRAFAAGLGALFCAHAVRAQNATGESLLAHGKIAAAESAFVRAIAGHAPDSLTAQVNLARLHFDRGERDRAMKEFDRFIDVYNNAGATLTSKEMTAVAIACQYLGRDRPDMFKDALRAFDRAILLDPANAEFYVTMSSAASRIRLYSVAASFALQGVDADPKNWEAHGLVGMNLLRDRKSVV